MELPKTLTERYRVKDKGKSWELWCKKCPKGWSLEKPDGDTWKGAGVLHLFNHAYSHDPQIEHDDE